MKKRKKTTTFMMAAFFIGIFILCLLNPVKEYSVAERRPLKDFPDVTWNSVQSGRFMEDFEDYALDQFPLRDGFRRVKAFIEKYMLGKQNNNEIYVEDGYAVQMVYPMNEESMENAAKVMKSVYETYLKENTDHVYFSMIPDKNYFLAKDCGQLSMDYSEFTDRMKENTSFMEYIDISDLLAIEDYYKTDSHWRQENIVDVARHLNESMGTSITGKYETVELNEPFNGVYSGQWALPLASDQMSLLINPLMEDYTVFDHENGRQIPVYDLKQASGDDMYELFLGGSLSLITIDNPNINTKKELILFRDSFGSSIAPILAEGYSKVTLIDIRYLPWERLGQFVDFRDKDVLFLYSTALLNHNEIK